MNINKLMDEIENELPFVGQTIGSYTNDDSVIKKHLASLRAALAEIRRLSDVGELFDGHDELNEDTHEANENLAIYALDRINQIIVKGYEE